MTNRPPAAVPVPTVSAARPLSRRWFLSAAAATAAAGLTFPHVLRGAAKKRKLVLIAGRPSHPPACTSSTPACCC
jgi:hypothetical protein